MTSFSGDHVDRYVPGPRGALSGAIAFSWPHMCYEKAQLHYRASRTLAAHIALDLKKPWNSESSTHKILRLELGGDQSIHGDAHMAYDRVRQLAIEAAYAGAVGSFAPPWLARKSEDSYAVGSDLYRIPPCVGMALNLADALRICATQLLP